MRTRSGGQPPACEMKGQPTGIRSQIPHPRADGDAGQAVATLYQMHYRALVRLAALLVSDLATAENIVQDSFAAVHGMWQALPDTDAALSYLRRSVVRRSRSTPCPQRTGLPLPGSAVVSALQALPVRQREVLVLQYFADLPEAEIASATGMSTAAVRSHAARAMSSLHAELRPGRPMTPGSVGT
jgi:DNA-directed RNA polymerase specialized sigma24 family protein